MHRMNEFSQHRMRRLRREANPRTRLTTLQSPGAGKFWQIHSLLWAKSGFVGMFSATPLTSRAAVPLAFGRGSGRVLKKLQPAPNQNLQAGACSCRCDCRDATVAASNVG